MPFLVLVICSFALFLPRLVAAQEPAPTPTSTRLGVSADPAGASAAQDAADKPWWERVKVGGDFRLRFETFRMEDTPDRNRARMRLRIALDTDVDENISVHFRLATGNPIDPSTSNQTFTDALTKKPFTVDYGYVSYQPQSAKGLMFVAGKFSPPVPHTSMTWEDNINWEGGYEQYKSPEKAVQVTGTAAQVSFAEVSDGPDALMFSESGEVSFRHEEHQFSVSVTNHLFRDPDPIALAVAAGELDLPNTNLLKLAPDGSVQGFQSGFHYVDVMGTALLQTSREQYPLKLTANWLRNLRAVTNEDTGLWLIGTYGLAETPKTFFVTYAYATIEQDAVLSPYMNNDVERTNVRTSIVEAAYKPTTPVVFVFTGFFPRGLRVPAGEPNPTLKRLQFNVEVSF